MVKFKSKLPSMIIACLMALVIMVSAVTPAFAAGTASVGSVAGDVGGGTIIGQDVDQGKQTEYDEFEVTGDMTSNADVYVTVPESDIMVTVPKVVILDGKSGASNVGTYTVKVQGDIAADTVINVEPQDEMEDRDGVNFEMSSAGKDNIPTDVEQAKTEFTYADGVRANAAASTTGTVTAYGMTAGQWNGDFVFNINATQAADGVGGISSALYAPIISAYKPNNMFDASKLTAGKAVHTNGTNALVNVAAHSASEEIAVKPETDYLLKIDKGNSSFRSIFILDDGTVQYQVLTISDYQGLLTKSLRITTPANCVSFRISGATELIETLYMTEAPTTTVAFNGDSITALPYGWNKLLADYFYFDEATYAIGGSTLANYGGTGSPDKTRDPLIERYTQMDANADVCMIFIGTNDWWYSWADIGTDEDTVTTTFKGALHALCNGLKEMYGDKPIIFLTPIKRGGDPNKTNDFGRTLEEYANAIIDVCGQYEGISVIDLYHNCPLDPSIPEQQAQFFDGSLNVNEGYESLYNDTTHPNVYGARVQARIVIDETKSILGK